MTAELAIGLALCGLLFSAICLVMILRLKGQAREQADKVNQRVRDLEKQITTATAGAVGIGQRIMVLEQKLQTLTASREQQDMSGDQQSYSQAMQMFDQGADVDTVVASCGLSHSEAQLMALVRKQTGKKPSARAGGQTGGRG